jgi:hypothetical protein
VTAQQVEHRLRVLWSRPDCRRNPLKAIAKRCIWRARWRLRADPRALRMSGELSIAYEVREQASSSKTPFKPHTVRYFCSFSEPGTVAGATEHRHTYQAMCALRL